MGSGSSSSTPSPELQQQRQISGSFIFPRPEEQLCTPTPSPLSRRAVTSLRMTSAKTPVPQPLVARRPEADVIVVTRDPAVSTPVNNQQWNSTMDAVYSRILYAEEYTVQIAELNGRIQNLSQRADRRHFQTDITEMLALCGHLQGELLRVYRMLAKNDPTLRNIAQFEESHGEVVAAIRSIQRQVTDVDNGAPPSSGDVIVTCSGGGGVDDDTAEVYSSDDEVERHASRLAVINENGVTRQRVVTKQRDEMLVLEEMTEKSLKQKHNEELSIVASNYAKKFTGTEQLTMDEVNRLLADHTKTVQRLRIRQQTENEQLNAILADKLRRRRLDHGDDVSDETGEYLELPSDSTGATNNGNLVDAVTELEALRKRGELTEEAVAGLMSKYLPPTGVSTTTAAMNDSHLSNSSNASPQPNARSSSSISRHPQPRAVLVIQDEKTALESASQIVRDTMNKQKELRLKKEQEQQHFDAILREKLSLKNQSKVPNR